MNGDRRAGAQCRHGKAHGDAVVVVRLDLAAAKLPADDADAVVVDVGFNAESVEAVSHHLDTVGLFYAQLFGTVEDGLPLRTRGGNKNSREFINRQRHQVFRDNDTFQFGAAHAQVGDRFATGITLVLDADIGTHQVQDIDDAGARRVHADMRQQQVGTFGNRGAHQEKRGRGNIRRHYQFAGAELATAADRAGGAIAFHRVTETGEHAFGVIAGWRRFRHRGFAFSVQTGQQDRRLDLRRRHRHLVVVALEGLAATNMYRRRALVAGLD